MLRGAVARLFSQKVISIMQHGHVSMSVYELKEITATNRKGDFSMKKFNKIENNVSAERKMKVVAIPALSDNYMYLLIDTVTKKAAVVDPVNPDAVFQSVSIEGVSLDTILTTHHHYDHAGGNEQLVEAVPGGGVTVYGGDDRIPALTSQAKQDMTFKIGSLHVRCLSTPCHTSGHICYYVTDDVTNEKAVFTGDTLFIAGCGRFFEGTADQMYDALVHKLGVLPDETKVYVGHEYTVKNLQFAKSVEPNNKHVLDKLQWAMDIRAKNEFTVPSTIGEEKQHNPFMRVQDSSLQKHVGKTDPIETMAAIRALKDQF